MVNLKYFFIFLALIVYATYGHAIEIQDFLPYGIDVGDKQMPTTDDAASDPIDISVKFPFFQNNFQRIFLSTNGLITFNFSFISYQPQNFVFPVTSFAGVSFIGFFYVKSLSLA